MTSPAANPQAHAAAIGELFRAESARILATLIRILGDFDLAEDSMQEAFAAALELWPAQGVPRNPRPWLISTARHKALDRRRRAHSFERKRELLAAESPRAALAELDELDEDFAVADDRLRLIFTCCHPALAPEAQVALTLRTLCGLSTEEIARAFLVPVPTLAQRLVRAKAKIRDAGVPYQVPAADLLPERLAGVLATVYLLFNEGYAATAGAALVRPELCREAIRLGRLLAELMPEQSEPQGLLALMLLHDARRDTRLDASGDLVLLEEQERARWDRRAIGEGLRLVESALRAARSGAPGPYALQAAIVGCHARAARAEETEWREIAALYAVLVRVQPSPVVRLNHAVAIAMRDGPEAGLERLDALAAEGALEAHHLLPAARADLLRRLGRWSEAAAAYAEARALAGTAPERRFLERRREEMLRRRAEGGGYRAGSACE